MAVPFYRYSYETAKDSNMVNEYRKSMEENRRCRDYIEDNKTGFYANAYKDYRVDNDGSYIKRVIEQFGMERTMFVFASTIKQHLDDGRITKEVKEWARNFNTGLRENESATEGCIQYINPGIVDILAKNVMAEYNKLNLFGFEHCEDKLGNLEGKVIVISPKYLKEEYWSPENQLWIATGGFGCSATAVGRAVYATCLYDGDETRWERFQVSGVLKDEYLPDWARKRLQEIQAKEEQNQEQNQENEINLS